MPNFVVLVPVYCPHFLLTGRYLLPRHFSKTVEQVYVRDMVVRWS